MVLGAGSAVSHPAPAASPEGKATSQAGRGVSQEASGRAPEPSRSAAEGSTMSPRPVRRPCGLLARKFAVAGDLAPVGGLRDLDPALYPDLG